LRRWKPGAPTRCNRRRDRPRRLGLTTDHRRALVSRIVLQVVLRRDHRFSARYPSVEKEGAVSQAGDIRPASPEMNCDRDKFDPVARDGIKESRPRIIRGGRPVRWMRSVPPAHGTRSAIATMWLAADPGRCHRRAAVSRRTRPAPSRFVTAQSGLPSVMVRCVVGAMTRLPSRHRCCVLPATAGATTCRPPHPRRRRPSAGPAGHGRPLGIVGTPTRALAAPSELHPAGRRPALTPRYPAYSLLLRSLERTCKRVKLRPVVAEHDSHGSLKLAGPEMLLYSA
jgi:hypothetical protein